MASLSTGFRTSAFGVTVRTCIPNHSFSHEMGHHRDGLDAHFPAGALDSQRDLAAIGYDDFIKHVCRPD
jgi:hypothetical protein